MNPIFLHIYKAVALGVLVVVGGAIYFRRKGAITWRWWAMPLFLLFLLLSFPVSVVTFSYIVFVAIPADVQLAPWVTDTWRDWGWLYAFAWLAGLWLVLKWRGVQFTSPETRKLVLRRLAVVVLPLTLLDGACFFFLKDTSTPKILAQGVSPDGKLRILAVRSDWTLSSSYEILVMQNKPWAFTATRLTQRGVYAVEPYFELANSVILWSKDSQAVVFGTEDTPIFAHDFSQSRTYHPNTDLSEFPNWNVGIAFHLNEFRATVQQLMEKHGGLAENTRR
jgi:hypothetical protein